MLARTLTELRAMSDEELVKEHDLSAVGTQVGVNYYLAELDRRAILARTDTMVRLTWAIAALTLVVAIATSVLLLREPSPSAPPADSSYRDDLELYVAEVLLFTAADARYASCLAEHGYSRGDTGQIAFLQCGSEPQEPIRPTPP